MSQRYKIQRILIFLSLPEPMKLSQLTIECHLHLDQKPAQKELLMAKHIGELENRYRRRITHSEEATDSMKLKSPLELENSKPTSSPVIGLSTVVATKTSPVL